jgi:hypothetical protein
MAGYHLAHYLSVGEEQITCVYCTLGHSIVHLTKDT